jgi:hypothetical protein
MRRADRRLGLRRGGGFDRRKLRAAAAAVAAWILAAPASGQMNVDTVTVTSGPAYSAGSFTDFFIDPEIQGSGIASITFSTQSGLSTGLVPDADGTWACDEVLPSGPCEDFTSLSQINALGDLTFSLQGTLGEMDTIVVPDADYDPGSGQSGFPVITAPTPGETGVSLTPTFTWNAAPGWVGAILSAVEVSSTGESIDEALLAASATSWMPSGLLAGTQQDFRLSFFDVFFLDDPRASSQSDAYLFSSGFEAFNFVSFTTAAAVPILGWASALLSLGFGVVGVHALHRRRAR